MVLIDRKKDGSFGAFFGHPDGSVMSKQLVWRMLVEFCFDFKYFEDLMADVCKVGQAQGKVKITDYNTIFKKEFKKRNWIDQPPYPESGHNKKLYNKRPYNADFGWVEKGKCYEKEEGRWGHEGRWKDIGRWIFVEVELSDIRRDVKTFYMLRVFRTGYMRLGVLIVPEIHTTYENKPFYTSSIKRYTYIAPEFPLWVIGFDPFTCSASAGNGVFGMVE